MDWAREPSLVSTSYCNYTYCRYFLDWASFGPAFRLASLMSVSISLLRTSGPCLLEGITASIGRSMSNKSLEEFPLTSFWTSYRLDFSLPRATTGYVLSKLFGDWPRSGAPYRIMLLWSKGNGSSFFCSYGAREVLPLLTTKMPLRPASEPLLDEPLVRGASTRFPDLSTIDMETFLTASPISMPLELASAGCAWCLLLTKSRSSPSAISFSTNVSRIFILSFSFRFLSYTLAVELPEFFCNLCCFSCMTVSEQFLRAETSLCDNRRWSTLCVFVCKF